MLFQWPFDWVVVESETYAADLQQTIVKFGYLLGA
jgi:hypothetical protein